MPGFGEGFKNIAKGFASDFAGASGSVLKGIPAKPGIKSNIPQIKSSIKGYQKPTTFSSAFSQVLKGSQVPQAGTKANFSGRGAWRDAAQKAKEKAQIAPVDPNLFTMTKKVSVTRQQSAWYFNEYLKKNPSLKMRLLKYNPKTSGESDIQWAKRIQNEWYGGVNEYASQYAGKVGISIEQQGDRMKIESRIKRVLEPAMRKERNSKRKEWRKLSVSTLRKFTGYDKK